MEQLFSGKTWMLRRMNQGRARLMIVRLRPTMGTHGDGSVEVALLDRFGRIIVEKRIFAGNRMWITAVHFNAQTRPYPCVTVDSDYFWFLTTQCQHIAIQNDRITEVRRLRQSSEPEGGRWRSVYHQVGPEERFATHAAWSKGLMSKDEIDVLEALLLLPPEEAIQARATTDIQRLQELSKSNDAWIRDGAKAALAEFDHRTN